MDAKNHYKQNNCNDTYGIHENIETNEHPQIITKYQMVFD